jgi:putative intracellular protease/amidase
VATALMPLPDRDFDPTEVAVPWSALKRAGHRVVFATERGGERPECDPLLIRGVLLGQLGAAAGPKALYAELAGSAELANPIAWQDIHVADYDALVLPGGHAPGMRQYLGSTELHGKVAAFAASGKPIGAICHGVLVLARSGALRGRKTTCLPKYMERVAYYLTAWKLGRYYRTYDDYVEDEVRAALAAPEDFVRGPVTLVTRGTADSDRGAFVVEDGRYVSARWPGDAYLFAQKLVERLA